MQMSRRELNKVRCRERILKASRRLFSAKGYENTMIEDVAERAEISKATLYNYFPNKESLLIGIAEEELEHIRRYLNKDLAEVEDAAEKLRRTVEFFVLDTLAYIDLSRKITYLNSCEDSSLYATRVEMRKLFRELAEEAQRQGSFRSDRDSSDIVDVVISVYLVSQFEWSHISSYTPEFCREKLNRAWHTMLAGVYVEPDPKKRENAEKEPAAAESVDEKKEM